MNERLYGSIPGYVLFSSALRCFDISEQKHGSMAVSLAICKSLEASVF
jgi:hypothetical protein